MGFFSSLLSTATNVLGNVATGNILGAVTSGAAGLAQATGIVKSGSGSGGSSAPANATATIPKTVFGIPKPTYTGTPVTTSTPSGSLIGSYIGQPITGNVWIDGALYGVVGGVVKTAMGTQPGQQVTDVITQTVTDNWFSKNWPFIAAAVIALIFLVRGKR